MHCICVAQYGFSSNITLKPQKEGEQCSATLFMV